MMQIPIQFMRALFRLPSGWGAWVMMLMTANMVFPFFFLQHLEAKIVLGSTILSAGIMMFLFHRLGFVRLLGLGHLPWVPLLVWLVGRLPSLPLDTLFGEWILAVLVLNTLSLIIDGVDVIRYCNGERTPYLPKSTPENAR